MHIKQNSTPDNVFILLIHCVIFSFSTQLQLLLRVHIRFWSGRRNQLLLVSGVLRLNLLLLFLLFFLHSPAPPGC